MKKRNAFTLIELLVVISIIALLAGLALPALNNARKEGFKIADVNNLKQVGMSIKMFANDYDGGYPLKYDSEKTRNEQSVENDSPANSNEAFRQMFPNTLKDERIFFTQGVPFFKKGDNKIDPASSECLKKGECSYSYFAGHTDGSDSVDILAWNPTSGGVQADGEKGWKATGPIKQIHSGNGINILCVDGSVSWKPKKNDGTIPMGGSEGSTKLSIKAVSPDV